MLHSLLKSICYTHLCLAVLSAGVSVVAQDKPARKESSASQSLSTGVLALQSQQQGLLFIDGQRVQPISPGSVVTLKLTTGQHFVDLRDEKGSILWQKIVEVPVGAQAAVLIDVQKQTESTPSPVVKTNSDVPSGAAGHATSEPSSTDHPATTPESRRATTVVPLDSKPT